MNLTMDNESGRVFWVVICGGVGGAVGAMLAYATDEGPEFQMGGILMTSFSYAIFGMVAAFLAVFLLAKTDLEKFRMHGLAFSIACGMSWPIIFKGSAALIAGAVGGLETKADRSHIVELAKIVEDRPEILASDAGRDLLAEVGRISERSARPDTMIRAEETLLNALSAVEETEEIEPSAKLEAFRWVGMASDYTVAKQAQAKVTKLAERDEMDADLKEKATEVGNVLRIRAMTRME